MTPAGRNGYYRHTAQVVGGAGHNASINDRTMTGDRVARSSGKTRGAKGSAMELFRAGVIVAWRSAKHLHMADHRQFPGPTALMRTTHAYFVGTSHRNIALAAFVATSVSAFADSGRA